jgi:hypothetical protein
MGYCLQVKYARNAEAGVKKWKAKRATPAGKANVEAGVKKTKAKRATPEGQANAEAGVEKAKVKRATPEGQANAEAGAKKRAAKQAATTEKRDQLWALPDEAKEKDRVEARDQRKRDVASRASQSAEAKRQSSLKKKSWKADMKGPNFKQVLLARIAEAQAGVSGGAITTSAQLKKTLGCTFSGFAQAAHHEGIQFVTTGKAPAASNVLAGAGSGWPNEVRHALAAWGGHGCPR